MFSMVFAFVVVFLLTMQILANEDESEFYKVAASETDDSNRLEDLISDGWVTVNKLTGGGESALHLACIYGAPNKIASLLKAGADPNYRAKKFPSQLQMTPLTWYMMIPVCML